MKNKLIIGVIAVVIVVGGIALLRKTDTGNKVLTGSFSTNIIGLAEAKQSEVVELKNGDMYNLTASIVKKTIGNSVVKMLAYNDMIPGPMIKVEQGVEITLNFTNDTDVDTTIHSHGVRLENKFDGVPDVTQKEVRPGESFTYKIKFPDEGMYWYHPHIREDYAQELGLYGNYLVTPVSANYWGPVNREIFLFLDDILMENGAIVPFSRVSANHTLMGRYGNVMLVNGDDEYRLDAKRGEVIRLYITNSANIRPFNFVISGAKMKLVGGDSGAHERDQWIDSIILGPSERAIIEVLFDRAGSYTLQNKTPNFTSKLGAVAVSEDPIISSYANSFSVLKTHDEVIKSIDPFRAYFKKEPDKQIKLSVDFMGNMQGMMGGGHMMSDGTVMSSSIMMSASKDGIEWEDDMRMMNAMSNADTVGWKIIDQETGKENMDIDWSFKLGEPVKIRIFNDPNSMHPMQHPIHFHGQRFLVVARDGVQQTNLVWKDTALVPSGQTVDILLDPSNPGEWMAHCHISEHLEAGMMFGFKVQ